MSGMVNALFSIQAVWSFWSTTSASLRESRWYDRVSQRFQWRWLASDPVSSVSPDPVDLDAYSDASSETQMRRERVREDCRTPELPSGLPHPAVYDDISIHDHSHPHGVDAGQQESISFYVEAEHGLCFGVGFARYISVLGQRRSGRTISFDGQTHGIVAGRLTWGPYYWTEELLHKFAMSLMLQAVTFSSFLRVELASLADASVGTEVHSALKRQLHLLSGLGELPRDTRLLRSFTGAFFDWITLQHIDYSEVLRCRCTPRWRRFVNIVYDNACNTMVWVLNRAPLAVLRGLNFFVDRLHWKDHTLCSWGFHADSCRGLDRVNTQV